MTIHSISVAVARDLVDRSDFDKVQLKAFESVTGIKKTRRWGGNSTSLALEAVRRDLERIEASQPEAVIVVTQSPDRNSPSMANEIAKELDLPVDTAVFDVNQSCSGFIYGLWLADALGSTYAKNILVVCVDRLRGTPGTLDSLIFSDAASASVVSGDCHPTSFSFFTDGSGSDKLHGDENGILKMNGGAVFDFVTKEVPSFIKQQFPDSEVLVQHQANLSMMKLVEARTGFIGRSVHSIEEFGNMSMNSIPAAIALKEKEIAGKKALLCGYGAGFSVAATEVLWPTTPVCKWVEV